MKVLTVISAYPPSVGGAQLHHHMLNRGLKARGHDVQVASLWRSNRNDWLRGTTIAAPPPRASDELDGIVVYNLGLDRSRRLASVPSALAYYAAMRAVAPALTRLYAPGADATVGSVEPDVAHLSRIGREWFYEAFVRALGERRIPFVLTPYHHPHWSRRRDWWWWSLYRRAARICVFTDAERQSLIVGGVAESRIVQVPSGPIDIPRHDLGADTDGAPPVVLFLGQVKPYKGLSVVYEAMRSVWSTHPQAQLVVVGPWVNERRKLRSQLDRDRRVQVLGAVPSTRKWQEIARSTVLCLPSTEESLGIVYLEAWQLEKPVIGADIPPVRELFDRAGGGLAVPQESSAVAEALLTVLGDEELARRLGRSGRAAVEHEFNWDVAAQLTDDVYRSVVERS